ncbi:HAD family hydrolase [Azospirillum sp. sgz301742]
MARERSLPLRDAADFALVTGKGVTGTVDGRPVALGNAAMMEGLGIGLGDIEARAEALRRNSATALYVAVDGHPAGAIAAADPVKASTPAALETLRAEGVRIVTLTGDNRTTAEAVARRLGIQEVEAEVLPDKKHQVVQRLKLEGCMGPWRGRHQRRPGARRGRRRRRHGDRYKTSPSRAPACRW